MSLLLDTGLSIRQGKKSVNDDACLVATPSSQQDEKSLFAISDTLRGGSEEDTPATLAIHTLKESFYSAPEGLGLEATLAESFKVANNALRATRDRSSATLSTLAIDERHWYSAHAGNTRIWLLRDLKLKQLTRDHVEHKALGAVEIINACGKSGDVDIESKHGEIQQGDFFLLTTDGVHDVIDGSTLMGFLMSDKTAQEIAENITNKALELGSKDNVSACVVHVEHIHLGDRKKPSQQAAPAQSSNQLAIRALPEKGETIDNYHIEKAIYKNRLFVVYKAIDQESGATVALKFPNPKFKGKKEFIEQYYSEEWRARRLEHTNLVKVLHVKQGRRSALYSVMEYHSGELLAKRIMRKKRLNLREALFLTKQILDGIEYLHEKGIVHQDIKPENILVDKRNRRALIISLGICVYDKLTETQDGTPNYRNYTAPELFEEKTKDRRTDIYSVGVILYKMLTGHYPYGKIRKHSDFSKSDFIAPEKYNKEIPQWLSQILKKACAVRAQYRYKEAASFSEEAYYIPEDMRKTKKGGLSGFLGKHWEQLLIISLIVNAAILVVWVLK